MTDTLGMEILKWIVFNIFPWLAIILSVFVMLLFLVIIWSFIKAVIK